MDFTIASLNDNGIQWELVDTVSVLKARVRCEHLLVSNSECVNYFTSRGILKGR